MFMHFLQTIKFPLPYFYFLPVDCGGGRGGRTDLHSGCQTPSWHPQQSNGKSHVMKTQKGLHWSYDTFSAFFPVFTQSTVSRSQSVKAGTEEKLVLHLLHSFAMGDSSYISIFLSTYRSFTSPKRVLDILNDRWEGFITTTDSTIKICIKKKNTYIWAKCLFDYEPNCFSSNRFGKIQWKRKGFRLYLNN